MDKQDSPEKKNTEISSEVIRGITYKRVKGSEITIQPWKGPKPSAPKDGEDPRSKVCHELRAINCTGVGPCRQTSELS